MATPTLAQPVEPPVFASVDRPVVILIGLDGFRADSLSDVEAPNLRRLAAEGLSSELIPVFPTLSFPNLWTLVTGLYPEEHGVVANAAYDPQTERAFQASSFKDPNWWGGEPIWVTAERQGHIAATTGWVGSESGAGGDRPTFWRAYADHVPLEVRVGEVLHYLDLPPERRPSLITFYSDWIDNNGHEYGPRSKQELQAIRDVDRAIGTLVQGIDARGLTDKSNLVIVADHGMAIINQDRFIFMDDLLELSAFHSDVAQGGFAYFWPRDGDVEPVVRALSGQKGLRLYRRSEMPRRWRNSRHPRTPPLIAVANEGWFITKRNDGRKELLRGMHGYDNNAASMRAFFLAWGPAFKRRARVDPFSSVNVYAMLAARWASSQLRTAATRRLSQACSLLQKRTSPQPRSATLRHARPSE